MKQKKHPQYFSSEPNGSVKEALRQIQDKDYAAPYMAKDKKIVCLGVNFSSETGTIEGYGVE